MMVDSCRSKLNKVMADAFESINTPYKQVVRFQIRIRKKSKDSRRSSSSGSASSQSVDQSSKPRRTYSQIEGEVSDRSSRSCSPFGSRSSATSGPQSAFSDFSSLPSEFSSVSNASIVDKARKMTDEQVIQMADTLLDEMGHKFGIHVADSRFNKTRSSGPISKNGSTTLSTPLDTSNCSEICALNAPTEAESDSGSSYSCYNTSCAPTANSSKSLQGETQQSLKSQDSPSVFK